MEIPITPIVMGIGHVVIAVLLPVYRCYVAAKVALFGPPQTPTRPLCWSKVCAPQAAVWQTAAEWMTVNRSTSMALLFHSNTTIQEISKCRCC